MALLTSILRYMWSKYLKLKHWHLAVDLCNFWLEISNGVASTAKNSKVVQMYLNIVIRMQLDMDLG